MRAPLLDGSGARAETASPPLPLDATLSRVPSPSAPERGGRELLRLTRNTRSRTFRAFWKRHVTYALFQKGGVELERAPFARDAVFVLTASVVLVSVFGNGAATEPRAWTLIGLYAAYACVVVLPGWVKALRRVPGGAIDHGWETRSVATLTQNSSGARARARARGARAEGEAFDEPFDDAYAALVGDEGEGGSLGSLGLVTELPSSREEEEEKRLGLGPRNGAPGMRWGGEALARRPPRARARRTAEGRRRRRRSRRRRPDVSTVNSAANGSVPVPARCPDVRAPVFGRARGAFPVRAARDHARPRRRPGASEPASRRRAADDGAGVSRPRRARVSERRPGQKRDGLRLGRRRTRRGRRVVRVARARARRTRRSV